MKKYMLIVKDEEGAQHATFYDEFAKAEDSRSIAEVSLGYYTEVYERMTDEEGCESYQLIY